jgi:hypothetical protein
MRIRHIAICGLYVSAVLFPTFSHNGTIFEKKNVIENKMCFDFLNNFCLKHFLS